MIRIALLRTIAIGLVVSAPLLFWWQWKNQTTPGGFDIQSAFDTPQTIAPKVDPVNVYDFDQSWTNQEGHVVNLQSFRGKPALVGFIYTQCTYACSVMTLRMKEVENWLPKSLKGQMQFLTFSIDPERDTPERLKEYASRFPQGLPHWTFMTSNQRQAKALAKPFEFYFKKEGEIFVHSDMIAVLDQDGVIRHQFWGNQRPEKMVEALKQMNEDGIL